MCLHPTHMIPETIREISRKFSGDFVLYAEHFQSGEVIAFGQEHPMETASTIKLAILVETMRQVEQHLLSLYDPIRIDETDMVTGSGILQHLSPGITLPLKDLLTLMIILSDNMATNRILRLIGLSNVNNTLTALGLHDTSIKKRIDFTLPGPIGLSTPRDLVLLLKKLYQGDLISKAASDLMWEILTRQQYNTIMTRDLPYSLLESSDEHTPPPVVVGSKSGALAGVRNDAGIVRTPWGDYAIAIMSTGCRDQRYHPDNEALILLPQVAAAVFHHFCPQAAAH
ncbi:MAG: class A beta-lactamase-related serine hydrolase [Firmicutes bacterium]|nr:class A beta-lactamase-related serine hydrolase [Bacillota bacterium]